MSAQLDYDLEALDSQEAVDRARGVVEPEKQVRITLAADWKADRPEPERVVPLPWYVGNGSRPSLILLRPGESVIQPLGKAQAYFGPFSVLQEIRTADDKRREELRAFFRTEKERYLNRYGWPMVGGDQKPDMRKTGHNRSPDVTVTILNSDGTEEAPIRLHKLYGIGEWDPEKENFVTPETLDGERARHAAELSARDEELSAIRRQMSETLGYVKGLTDAKGGK